MKLILAVLFSVLAFVCALIGYDLGFWALAIIAHMYVLHAEP